MSADPRFFGYAGPRTLSSIAAAIGGISHGEPERLFSGISSLDAAEPDDVSFCETPRYVSALQKTRAGAVVVTDKLLEYVPPDCVAITSRSPSLAFARLAQLFHPNPRPKPGIHPTALVAEDAVIGQGSEIGPMSIVGAGARIGAGCLISPFVNVGPGVVLGSDCILGSHVSISHAICGDGVVLHPGAKIGQEGFGFGQDGEGGFETAPQLGLVELGDRVQIGANACVDRGGLGNTVLGSGTRIDNLVQVGHNVRTGRGCVMAAQVGISGSTVFGDYVSAGGQAGFSGHLSIGKRARIGAQSGVINDLPSEVVVFGTPARPTREVFRSLEVLKRLTAESRLVKKREAE